MAHLESEIESRSKQLKPVKLEDVDDNGARGEPEAYQEAGREKGLNSKEKEKEKEEEEEEGEDDDADEDAKPIGKPIGSSGEGRMWRSHYKAFKHDGHQYKLEDTVLLFPAEADLKPYVAIIKNIAQTKTGKMMVKVQWLYRAEEIEKQIGGTLQAHDNRELFYSFHQDEVPAESVMHKCVVHLIPTHKQYPPRGQNCGFIVQKIYDVAGNKLLELTDEVCRLIVLSVSLDA